MIDSTTLRHHDTYSVSLPTFAAPPALARATVYMPSSVAARLIPAALVSAYRRRDEESPREADGDEGSALARSPV